MKTKELIIYESLKLFATNGFEGVSTRMIARAVGVSDTALYKHFKSKQEIFDTCIVICKEKYLAKVRSLDMCNMHWRDVERVCMEMYHFQKQDEWIGLFRKALMMEQFRNTEMAHLFRSFFIDFPIQGMVNMFAMLMENGYMKKNDPRTLSMELYAPFFMYHTMQSEEEEVLEQLRKHIANFIESYRVPPT